MTTSKIQVKTVDTFYVAPDGEKFTIRTITRSDATEPVYVTFRGGWRHKEYVRKSSVRAYIIKYDLREVVSHDDDADDAMREMRATIARLEVGK